MFRTVGLLKCYLILYYSWSVTAIIIIIIIIIIPNFLIKGCSEIFTPLLHYIFNLSLLTGSFPRLWKKAAVVPIFKKGNSALVTNYRPISILNNFSKILESIVHDHLSFNFRSKLHPSQHGFI
jgi:hypothetical protein